MHMPGSITVDPRAVLEEKTIAIMDLGSNSLRLMLAHVQPDGSYEKLDKRGKKLLLAQDEFCKEAVKKAREAKKQELGDERVFVPKSH